ncbi:MAG: tRNA (adenosine(37)-N6)-threonylcarbamoyltransferase complex ATPase subunit type 1 TsaE [Lentisphaeria bacterium]|jgi:tRNA threonylcarbamoyladenosine biosynthesis protein TsaE|nr:tRNA (adenosine(37)-N6)-threonylcarbamoyltransferase complex ATPase subunit type 1 TsaE [Lentisphaeria bacterium]
MSTPTVTLVSESDRETEAIGQRLARQLRPGMVVALEGDLGAGKTVLSRGIARGLGIEEPVTSPTFTVVQEYTCPSGLLLYHLDMYRIDDETAALAFGIEEFLYAPDGVTVVEWPERIAGLLGEDAATARVRLEHLAEGKRRLVLPRWLLPDAEETAP